MKFSQVVMGLVVGVFAKSWVFPTWSSAFELVSSLLLVAGVYFLESRKRPQSITELEKKSIEELHALSSSLDDLRSQIKEVRLRVGFRPVG